MSEYFKYEALDIPDKPATEVLKSKGLDLDFTPRQYQFIPELNTGDFHIKGLNLDGYFSINKAKEPVQYKYTQLKLNHNTPSKINRYQNRLQINMVSLETRKLL